MASRHEHGQAAVDPPPSDYFDPDPDCPACHGKGRIQSGVGPDGYQSEPCAHCCPLPDARDREADRDDEHYHRGGR